ncbi:MAG TPA: serine/threonine-protein kinase [Gemmataceae bacterium]|nr:serine/threonine-protein kinase [Gemmataceae bacterium]
MSTDPTQRSADDPLVLSNQRTEPNTPGTSAAAQVSHTATAPLFRSPAEMPRAILPKAHLTLQVGDCLDDFELLSELGSGSFARVFLARQNSLNRYVAVKVSADSSGEARTLARLEHDHIVHVFAETLHPARQLRILCMQYVPGTTLAGVIAALRRRPPAEWSGPAILEAIDVLSKQPAAFEPAALRDREILAASDFIEAVCWLGARLAEAVAYAHSQGVLHRDIKPANILLNRYGRPFLADFNVAFDPRRVEGSRHDALGGTLAYMAPEHLEAWSNPKSVTVDHRADLYSLGVVLFELLTSKRPFADRVEDLESGQVVPALVAARKAGAPSPRQVRPEIPEELDRVIRRCLEPCPDRRYQMADELAGALEGCRQMQQAKQELPAPGPVTRIALRHPIVVVLGMTLLPHFLGSVVNISYNRLQIVSHLAEAQQTAFHQVVTVYNAVIYVLCILCLYALIYPLYRAWVEANGAALPDAARMESARRRALWLPLWAIVLSCVGWLPGGVLFPVAIGAAAGPLPSEVYGHFAVSFTISGLIALTYSFLAVQFLVLRVFYPRFWVDARNLREKAAAELAGVGRRLGWVQLLAGLIPLTGAVLMVVVGPEQEATSDYATFRVLVTALIALGMVGFGLALATSSRITQCVAAFTGGVYRRPTSF